MPHASGPPAFAFSFFGRSLLSCPVCVTGLVGKFLMGHALVVKKEKKRRQMPAPHAPRFPRTSVCVPKQSGKPKNRIQKMPASGTRRHPPAFHARRSTPHTWRVPAPVRLSSASGYAVHSPFPPAAGRLPTIPFFSWSYGWGARAVRALDTIYGDIRFFTSRFCEKKYAIKCNDNIDSMSFFIYTKKNR